MTKDFKFNFEKIRDRIERAAEKAGRKAEDVKLVAVSKTQPIDVLGAAFDAGIDIFGENKVQEAEDKIAGLIDKKIEWHLIGHLQSNKARKAVKLFDWIHSVDTLELAERLERICIEENRRDLKILAQVDLANEATKSGVSEKNLPDLVEYLKGCERLKFSGFMILPPFFEDAEKNRPFFKRLVEIRDEFLPEGELSMGMSNDFEIAVEEGATIVRVGTAIFGERQIKVMS